MKPLATLLVLTFFIAPVAHASVNQQETTLQCTVDKDLETKADQELPLFAITGGFLDGILNSAWSLLSGTATLVFHPIQSYQSLTTVTASQLANAVYEGLKGRVSAVVEVDPNSFISIYNASYAVGQTTFDVCTVACTIGFGVVVKGTQVAKISIDVSNAANKAAEVEKISSALKVAADASAVKASLQIGSYLLKSESAEVTVSSELFGYSFKVVRNFKLMVQNLNAGKLASGSTVYFKNMEKIAPEANDLQYYKEFIIPTVEKIGTGPERLLVGKNGELVYTSDHYKSGLDLITGTWRYAK